MKDYELTCTTVTVNGLTLNIDFSMQGERVFLKKSHVFMKVRG